MSAQPPRQSPVAGIAIMAVAMALFAAMHATVRVASAEVHPFEIAFFRNLFGLVAILPWFVTRGLEPLATRRFPLHLKRSVLNVAAMLTFFVALSMTPLALVQALSFTSPLFATALAVVFLGERLRARRLTALGAGFVGMLIILRPGVQPVELGPILTVLSALVWAVCLILIKRLSETDSAITITAWMVLLMTPLTGVAAAFVWTTPSLEMLAWMLACGILGTIAQLLMTQALKMADATVVMPLDFTKLIWGALIGWLAFGELVDGWTWLGAAVVFSGAFYIALRERQLARRAAEEDR